MLAAAARYLADPLILDWHNAAGVFSNPVETHIGIVLLSHQLGYFDILPLYVTLMVFAPGVAVLYRCAPALLIPTSVTIYILALIFRINFPNWPTQGQWFFNPFAWQLLFTLGFILAADLGGGAIVRRHIRWIRLISAPIVVVGVLVVWNDWWPDPTRMPEPRLLFVADKTYMTPMRLFQFLALTAVGSVIYPYVVRALPGLVAFLSMLGRNSLNVFCVGSILSLCGQIVRYVNNGNILIDTVILATGIIGLGLAAWVSEWRARTAQ